MVNRFPDAPKGKLPLPKRSKTFGRELDILLDQYYSAIEELQNVKRESTVETIFNDSGNSMEQYLLYGRDVTTGELGPAFGQLEPSFQALAAAGDAQEVPIKRGGRTRLVLADPNEAVSRGQWAYLSSVVAGRVTAVPDPAQFVYRVGHFASSSIDGAGTVEAWLHLFAQAGGIL